VLTVSRTSRKPPPPDDKFSTDLAVTAGAILAQDIPPQRAGSLFRHLIFVGLPFRQYGPSDGRCPNTSNLFSKPGVDVSSSYNSMMHDLGQSRYGEHVCKPQSTAQSAKQRFSTSPPISKTPTRSKLARLLHGHDMWLQTDSTGRVTAHECPSPKGPAIAPLLDNCQKSDMGDEALKA
jgi:hypothetical protein